jgi:outer membrane immunogenic protein
MKKLLLGAIFAAFTAGLATAADMPLKAMPAPVAPVYNWTGLYVDGGFGYGMWTADTTTVSPVTGACVLCVTQTQGGKGWFGTIGGGYDWQFRLGNWNMVAGALGGYDFSSIEGTIQDQGPFFAGREKMTSAWYAGARLGWLPSNDVLTYVNGGWTGAHFNGTNMVGTFVGTSTTFGTPAFSTTGWFLGGGVEYMILPGWFSRTEYRLAHYDNNTLPDTGTIAGVPISFSSITFQHTVQTVRTELVYKFNWFK